MGYEPGVTSTASLKSTTDYDMFKLMGNNRMVNRGHVEAIKRAIEIRGNLTKVHPILVNDRFEVIDGQHRLTACRELGEPIFYNVVPGLGVDDAREMNLLHRGWGIDDYAHSYAESGREHYIKYLELQEEYGYSHSVMLSYCNWKSERRGMFAEFREGDFAIAHEPSVRERLDMLKAVEQIVGARIAGEKVFAEALLKVSQADGFSLKRMLKKLEERKDFIKRYTTIEDASRQFEEIYNYMYSEANRVRLY